MTETSVVRPILAPLSLVLAAAGLACSSVDAQGPDVPDVRGTYEGQWTLSMQSADATEQKSAECRGTVTVASQTDTSFAGSFRIDSIGETTGDLSCRVVEGDLKNTRLGTGGLASFRPLVGDTGAAAALAGCEGSALWQGDFTPTPDRPEEARLDAGARPSLSCEQPDGSERGWEAEIQFRGQKP